nr:Retrovirus-related Pol polyprotein from transposon RE1 [Ipomoea batatas]
MTVHLEASDLWQAIDEDYEVAPLPANPTMAQMKLHKEKTLRKSKAKACMFSAVSSSIFTKIMRLKTANDIWDYLKKEYQGNERTRNMQILNLIREFEMMKMKEAETIKEYSNTLLGIANKIRLLDKDFLDDRIVQKILAPEQRRMLRNEEPLEGAFQAKAEGSGGGQDRKNFKKKKAGNNIKNETYPPCPHCKKTNHPQRKCWWRPDVKCRKCGKTGHMERICKSQQHEEAKASTEQNDDDQLFVATCFATSNSSGDSWLIDSGCTNHMTNDRELFKELDKTTVSKVKIGNGVFLPIKGKGTLAIQSLTGVKYISNVLYVPDIDQNLLSVGQLIEKGFKVLFEDQWCLIKDAQGKDVFKVKMRSKSFALNLMEEEQMAFSSIVSNAELWHKRLGHFHHAGLIHMQRHNLVKGVPLLEDKVADCVACQYGKQVKRDKLDKKAEPGIFIGYSNTSKAYRIFQPQNGKCLISRDVKFMEDKQWNCEVTTEKQHSETTTKMQFLEFPQHIEDDINDDPVEGNVEQFPGTPEHLDENIDHVLVRATVAPSPQSELLLFLLSLDHVSRYHVILTAIAGGIFYVSQFSPPLAALNGPLSLSILSTSPNSTSLPPPSLQTQHLRLHHHPHLQFSILNFVDEIACLDEIFRDEIFPKTPKLLPQSPIIDELLPKMEFATLSGELLSQNKAICHRTDTLLFLPLLPSHTADSPLLLWSITSPTSLLSLRFATSPPV